MKLQRSQSGFTFISLVFFIITVVFFANLIMKLAPAYLEYFNVSTSLSSLQDEQFSSSALESEIRGKLEKRLNINDVKHVKSNNISIQDLEGKAVASIDYEVRTNILANIDAIVHFSKSVEISY